MKFAPEDRVFSRTLFYLVMYNKISFYSNKLIIGHVF